MLYDFYVHAGPVDIECSYFPSGRTTNNKTKKVTVFRV